MADKDLLIEDDLGDADEVTPLNYAITRYGAGYTVNAIHE
jgi:hypothetical protein